MWSFLFVRDTRVSILRSAEGPKRALGQPQSVSEHHVGERKACNKKSSHHLPFGFGMFHENIFLLLFVFIMFNKAGHKQILDAQHCPAPTFFSQLREYQTNFVFAGLFCHKMPEGCYIDSRPHKQPPFTLFHKDSEECCVVVFLFIEIDACTKHENNSEAKTIKQLLIHSYTMVC